MKEDKELEDYIMRELAILLGIHSRELSATPSLPPHLRELFLNLPEKDDQSQNHFVPLIDDWLVEQRKILDSKGIQLESPWPEGRKFVVCLTHDLDAISRFQSLPQIFRVILRSLKAKSLKSVLGAILRFKYLSLKPSIAESIERAIEIEAKFGLRSSFFVSIFSDQSLDSRDSAYELTDVCMFKSQSISILELLLKLQSEGHEIGLHGSYHSADNLDLLLNQKNELERMLESKIKSTRQHYLQFDRKQTFKFQHEAGILADSSLGFNRKVGFRNSISLGFFAFQSKVLELPLALQDSSLFKPGTQEIDEHKARETFLRILENTASKSGMLCLSFHPEHFHNEKIYKLYEYCLKTAHEMGASFARVSDVYQWRVDREQRLGFK